MGQAQAGGTSVDVGMLVGMGKLHQRGLFPHSMTYDIFNKKKLRD